MTTKDKLKILEYIKNNITIGELNKLKNDADNEMWELLDDWINEKYIKKIKKYIKSLDKILQK